jgi:hypothetical protein
VQIKKSQLKSLENFNEAKRNEKIAEDKNKVLLDKISKLESDLDN